LSPAYGALLRELNRARRFLLWRSVERAGVFAAALVGAWLVIVAGSP